MPVVVRLKVYLEELIGEEVVKPVSERKKVPSVAQLAQSAGVHQTTLSRIVNRETKKVDLDILDKVITELRRLGFRADVSDIMEYRIPTERQESES